MTSVQSESLLTIDGVDLWIRRRGAGPPVVCLHSVGHDGRDFDSLADRCADRFEFISVDWPGHGRSSPDPAPASAARYAEILEGVLDGLGIVEPILIGNSIGGAAAILCAGRRPVRGLVLCDSGGLVAVNAGVRAFCSLFERLFAAGARGASWYPAAFDLYYRLVLPEPAARPRRDEIIAESRRLAPLLRQAWASFARPDADLRAAAAALDAPIWVAWARSDRIIPLAMVRPVIDRMKSARLSLFKGGHTPFLEQPDEFAAAFREIAGSW